MDLLDLDVVSRSLDAVLHTPTACHLLEDDVREILRVEPTVTQPSWDRGKGWAFQQAIGAAWYYVETNPDMHDMGMTTLRRLLESEK